MRLFLSSLCIALAVTLLQPLTPAWAQAGILLRTFNLKADRLLLDPIRPRLYATLPLSNSVAVIDTNTNALLTTFFIGSDPVDMAISPDGARLYVANGGSDSAAIGVVELDTLTVRLSLPAPGDPTAIAAGLDNRLYVLCSGNSPNSIVQMDGTTGAVQTVFGSVGGLPAASSFGSLQISPDRKTLFYGGASTDLFGLVSFDVSTTIPQFAQQASTTNVGDSGQAPVINHEGDYLADTNSGNDQPYGISLIPTNNLSAVAGTFTYGLGGRTGPSAFSIDDTLFYEACGSSGTKGQYAFRVFSTATFKVLEAFDDPSVTTYNIPAKTVTSIAVTTPHGYLYVAARDDTKGGAPYDLQMIGTQRAPFFDGSVALSNGYYYLKFSNGTPFAYYNFNYSPYLYHDDLGFEFPFDAADGRDGIYLYDFASQTFWYTSPGLYPYLYDFSVASWLYYYPDPGRADHYNTDGVRYFYDFADGGIIAK